MKVITHRYSKEQKWIEVLADTIGGTIEGNFIRGNNEFYTGTHFFLVMGSQISAMLIDTTYKETVLLEYKNNEDRFIGLFYYATNYDVNVVLNNETTLLGREDYNLSVIDSMLDLDYLIDKDTKTYFVCIFIDKVALKEYMNTVPKLKSLTEDFFNVKKNTIISMERMSLESTILINDFRKIDYTNTLFEFHFRGLVYKLISDYVVQLFTKRFIISTVIGDDAKKIISSKALLIVSSEGVFPGVNFLAEQVNMSTSKYKKLFAKISGLSPGTFFYDHKLERAKYLLETGKYTVGEVADKLNYANVSYLARRFNSKYGVLPKEYQNLL